MFTLLDTPNARVEAGCGAKLMDVLYVTMGPDLGGREPIRRKELRGLSPKLIVVWRSKAQIDKSSVRERS